MDLCWQNLSVFVNVTKKSFWKLRQTQERLKLLHNVSGVANAGTLSAIIGPSGAGKTTLLATIGQRKTGAVHGEVLLNGRPVDQELMLKIAGLVPQNDLVISTLTITEHINFMANLKMDRRVYPDQRRRIVNNLIQDLGLDSCRRRLLSQLSGGEKKRVALAAQLVTDPPIILADEPTTGLDSYNAAVVVELLRRLASQGKVVLCTIHQPTSGIFEMFDTVTILAPGGRLAYFGLTSQTAQYFADFQMVCPPAYNLAEFIVDKVNVNSTLLVDSFANSLAWIELNREIELSKKSGSRNQLLFGIDEGFLKYYSVQPPLMLTQLQWLMWRSYLDLYRSSRQILLRLVMYLITGLVVSMPFVGVQIDQLGIQNLQGLNYSVITETIFNQTYSVLHTFPSEVPVLLRDVENRVYKPAPYYISKIILMVPRVIIEVFLFCTVIHLVTGIEGGLITFLSFALPAIMSGITSSAYGFCISAMFENISSASLLSVPLDFISYTFSGIFLQLSTLPSYLTWVKYISRFYYGLEAISILKWSSIENIPCSDNPDVPCVSNGNEVLIKYGYNPQHLGFDFFGLLIMFLVLHIVGYLFLKRRSRKRGSY